MAQYISMFFYLQPMMLVFYIPWVVFVLWILAKKSGSRISLGAIVGAGMASFATIVGLGILFFSLFGIQEFNKPTFIFTAALLIGHILVYSILFSVWIKVFTKTPGKTFAFISIIANSCIGLALWCMYSGIWSH